MAVAKSSQPPVTGQLQADGLSEALQAGDMQKAYLISTTTRTIRKFVASISVT
jgi:hypothetical protein